MRTITIQVTDEKYEEVLSIIKTLDFRNEEKRNDYTISEKEKEIIRSRIKNSVPGQSKTLEEVKENLKFLR